MVCTTNTVKHDVYDYRIALEITLSAKILFFNLFSETSKRERRDTRRRHTHTHTHVDRYRLLRILRFVASSSDTPDRRTIEINYLHRVDDRFLSGTQSIFLIYRYLRFPNKIKLFNNESQFTLSTRCSIASLAIRRHFRERMRECRDNEYTRRPVSSARFLLIGGISMRNGEGEKTRKQRK